MFITFEGPDGAGKSTQVRLLLAHLLEEGYAALATREPGGTRIGEQIRDVLHQQANAQLDPRAELLLFSASRAQIVAEVIRPALALGQIVLCDRFYDSTFAYQGYGHGLPLDDLAQITRFATGGLKPDLTFFLDVDPLDGLRRRMDDTEAEWTRMDALTEAFHLRVRQGYEALIAAEPERWLRIDGRQPVEAVQASLRAALRERMAVK